MALVTLTYAVSPAHTPVAVLAAGAFFSLSVGDALAAIARAQERHRLVATAHVVGAVMEATSLLVFVWLLEHALVGLAASLCLRFVRRSG